MNIEYFITETNCFASMTIKQFRHTRKKNKKNKQTTSQVLLYTFTSVQFRNSKVLTSLSHSLTESLFSSFRQFGSVYLQPLALSSRHNVCLEYRGCYSQKDFLQAKKILKKVWKHWTCTPQGHTSAIITGSRDNWSQ